MAVNFQSLLNSRLGIALALGFGRVVPAGLGHRLAAFIAGQIARRPALAIVRTVRANQWVVAGERLSPGELDCAVRDTFRNTARCLFDLYHHLGNPADMLRLVAYNDAALEMIERSQRGKEAAVVTGVHLSNFDLILHVAGLLGLKGLVLSAAQPAGGYRWQNELRRQHGLEITPASPGALRLALERLQAGGSVLTGVDRPVPGVRYRPRFFGREATLPSHHIYLALKTRVPVYVSAAILDSAGVYRVEVSQPISMRQEGDRHSALIRNAEAILEVAEDFIRRAPQQWSMYYPVWPEVLQGGTAGIGREF
jgi:KDO2-lipid IV(A) lauroyltransferase